MNSKQSRDAILARVRQALAAPSIWHGFDSSCQRPLFDLPHNDVESLLQRFRDEFQAVQGEYFEFDSMDKLASWFASWRRTNALGSILAVENPLVRTMLEQCRSECSVDWTGAGSDRRGWPHCELGVTPCESFIAECGAIVVSSALSGRAPSVLPPVHLVVATRDQLEPDIESAIVRLRSRYPDQLPSSISLIAGPSRTGDIEKILVLGAHGPKRLVLAVAPSRLSL